MSAEQGDLTLAEVTELVGDDVAFWLQNPFMDRDALTEKVRWWVSEAVRVTRANDAPERDRAAEVEAAEDRAEQAAFDAMRERSS